MQGRLTVVIVDIREALDQGELVGDLAALLLDLLLCVLELLGRGTGLEGDLWRS